MSMAIYLSYLLLEVVMLIRISILNYEQDFSITLRDSKIVLQRESLTLAGLERWERWGGVQAHVLVLQRSLEQREQDDQDEDEVE
jgi:hypothetical protein